MMTLLCNLNVFSSFISFLWLGAQNTNRTVDKHTRINNTGLLKDRRSLAVTVPKWSPGWRKRNTLQFGALPVVWQDDLQCLWCSDQGVKCSWSSDLRLSVQANSASPECTECPSLWQAVLGNSLYGTPLLQELAWFSVSLLFLSAGFRPCRAVSFQ